MSTFPTLIALATYNEIESLPEVINDLLKVAPSADLLVIDDNSPDGTGRWCDERAASEPRLVCLHRDSKQGLGTAALVAIRHALDGDYRVLVTLDADGSHDPASVPALLAAIEGGADVAIGSRYCEGGEIVGWPFSRRAISRVLNTASRALLRLPVCDASGAFRAYRVEALRRLSLEQLHATGYAYLEEILWHLDRGGARFAEVPITFRQRAAGSSKASWREAMGKVKTIGRLAAKK